MVVVVGKRRLDVDPGEQLARSARRRRGAPARIRSSFSSCPIPSAAEMSSSR